MLQARDLTKTYASIPAVKDVTFSLESGQVLGCLGPNGSGKSTTVKMLIGLLEPTHGKVLFKGNDIRKDLVGFRKCLGYVPEEANLYPYLSGYEYLLTSMLSDLRAVFSATYCSVVRSSSRSNLRFSSLEASAPCVRRRA